MVCTLIRGLTHFVLTWEYVEFEFHVEERAYAGLVASGMLIHA